MQVINTKNIVEAAEKKAGEGFGVCNNPEFLREGSSVYDFYNPPNVVQEGARFSWDDVADPGTEPDPTWALSMIRRVPIDPADTTVVQMLLWNVIIPAETKEEYVEEGQKVKISA